MRYNLTPLLEEIDESIPSFEDWKKKIHLFFSNPHYDGELKDRYYNILLQSLPDINPFLKQGYLIDEYSGIFTINSPETRFLHTFNLANFIRRNHQYFYKKRIKTYAMDYGVLNVQIKQCGLELEGSVLPFFNMLGIIFTVIGNQCSPFFISGEDNEDVLIVSCMFNNDDQAYQMWNYMLDSHLDGKDVFFSSQTFEYLQNHVIYDKIKQVEDPTKIYDKEVYSNLDYGFQNKIYQIV